MTNIVVQNNKKPSVNWAFVYVFLEAENCKARLSF